MAKTTLFSGSHNRRIHTLVHDEDGVTRFETRQDVDPIIKAASILSDVPPDKDFTRVALLPMSEYTRAIQEGWFHDEAAWNRWLNDPANDCYRTWHGGTL